MNATAPFVPEHAPFSHEQRAWLNGFFAGIFSRGPVAADAGAAWPIAAAPTALQPLTILWGSQTGTAESLAKQAAKTAGQRGFAATVLDLASVDLAQLGACRNVLLITSTYGDGEPPDNAKALHAAVWSDGASALPAAMRYSICGLGDTNYSLFCQCGKDFDAAFEKLGATRIAPRIDCDLDYEEPFARWLDAALAAFSGCDLPGLDTLAAGAWAAQTQSDRAGRAVATATDVALPVHSKANPFPAPVRTVRRLSGEGSAKEVNHLELSLEGSGLSYEAGDALAVQPQNCPGLVEEILTLLGCDGEEPVPTIAGERPLRTALWQHFDLGKPAPDLFRLLGIQPDPSLLQVIDVLALPGARRPAPTDFAQAVRRLQPRLYSISSSPKAHPDEVHLTVGAVRYEAGGRVRQGVCSTFLAERALATGTVPVHVHANPNFRPPADPATPMIMIGPGTGIAPFRAFLEERAATGATGRNWLFFGDQRASTDFLYQADLDGWRADGLLHRLDTAFSRDQAEKVYVQHRMLEQAPELWAWLEAGAHVYVCGDAARMAKDVDQVLHRVIEAAGGRSSAEAVAYVQSLRAAKRYARDVY